METSRSFQLRSLQGATHHSTGALKGPSEWCSAASAAASFTAYDTTSGSRISHWGKQRSRVFENVHSHQLTWKCTKPLSKRSVHFQVSREGRETRREWALHQASTGNRIHDPHISYGERTDGDSSMTQGDMVSFISSTFRSTF